MDDGGLDDPIEPEDPTDVRRKERSSSSLLFLHLHFSRPPTNVNPLIHTRRKI